MRDLYNESEKVCIDAFGDAEAFFPHDIFNLLCDEDDNEKSMGCQNINCLLDQIEDLKGHTKAEILEKIKSKYGTYKDFSDHKSAVWKKEQEARKA